MPGNLVATALGVSQVKLTWAAATDNVRARKYEVERKDPGSARFVHLGTTTGTSYTDTGLAAGGNYSYRVLVRDARGRLKEYSGVASVTTGSPTIVPRSAPITIGMARWARATQLATHKSSLTGSLIEKLERKQHHAASNKI